MRTRLFKVLLVLAAFIGLMSVGEVSAQGVPQDLKTIKAKIATIEGLLSSINDKLDDAGAVPTVLVTGPLQRSGSEGANFKCMVVNAGSTDATFTIEIRNQAGGVEDSGACVGMAPGSVCSVEAGATADPITYCRVSGISSANARVTHCLRDPAVCVAFVTAP